MRVFQNICGGGGNQILVASTPSNVYQMVARISKLKIYSIINLTSISVYSS